MAQQCRVDQELLEQGFALFQSRPDKEWSLTDCISFQLRRHAETRHLAGFHYRPPPVAQQCRFEQAGFERLLKP